MAALSDNLSDTNASLSKSVTHAVQNYFAELKGTDPVDLYQFVLEEVEIPLFKAVMEHCKYNQSRAAFMLGVSRGTLRTKLRHYFDDKYVGTRED
ncbi:MAG: Fis family transcriptional regulator [Legionellaceae bacterium]|nr:Fis family transcriptional regulator [Legionellaceae bacterium]HAF87343.1 Fis family transcriptional regulator [Legionellales bacterium]HCA88729.1 Fis family transcriptional regulator [Legionellales bacterium]|tara:strand:- start:3122 stop:3406 length:285 start_codon:yes stop_codon:yes gene_type:complete